MLPNPFLPLSPSLSLSPTLSLSVFSLSPLPELGDRIDRLDLGEFPGQDDARPPLADLDHRGGGPDVIPILAELDVPAGDYVVLDIGLAGCLDELVRVGGSRPLQDVGDDHDP